MRLFIAVAAFVASLACGSSAVAAASKSQAASRAGRLSKLSLLAKAKEAVPDVTEVLDASTQQAMAGVVMKLASELSALKGEADRLVVDPSVAVEDRKAELEAELAAVANATSAVRAQNDATTDAIRKLQRDISERKREVTRLTMSNEKIVEKLHALQGSLTSMTRQFSTAGADSGDAADGAEDAKGAAAGSVSAVQLRSNGGRRGLQRARASSGGGALHGPLTAAAPASDGALVLSSGLAGDGQAAEEQPDDDAVEGTVEDVDSDGGLGVLSFLAMKAKAQGRARAAVDEEDGVGDAPASPEQPAPEPAAEDDGTAEDIAAPPNSQPQQASPFDGLSLASLRSQAFAKHVKDFATSVSQLLTLEQRPVQLLEAAYQRAAGEEKRRQAPLVERGRQLEKQRARLEKADRALQTQVKQLRIRRSDLLAKLRDLEKALHQQEAALELLEKDPA